MSRLLKSGPWPQTRSAGIGLSGSSRAVLMFIGAGFGYFWKKSQPVGSLVQASFQFLKYGGDGTRLSGSDVVSFQKRSNFVLNAFTSIESLVRSTVSSS